MPWKRAECIIPCCQAAVCNFPDRKFFRFPKEGTPRFQIWEKNLFKIIDVIKRQKRPLICSIHFKEGSIGMKYLKPHAVPTLELGVSQNEITNEFVEGDDFTFDELNNASLMLEKGTAIIEGERSVQYCKAIEPMNCNHCIKNLKRIKLYSKVNEKLKETNKKLKADNARLRRQNAALKTKVGRLKKRRRIEKVKPTLEDMIDCADASESSKTFSKIILHAREDNIYNENERWLCQSLYFRSSSSYIFLRDNLELRLPSISSLHHWIKIKCLAPGISYDVLEEIRKNISSLTDEEQNVVLVFDEMSIQEGLAYDERKDEVYGFVDYGDDKCNTKAKSCCVFMIRSICGNFNQILYYVACPGFIPAENIQREVSKCLDICQYLGVNVQGTVCDQGPTNRKFLRLNEVSVDKPFFIHKNKKV